MKTPNFKVLLSNWSFKVAACIAIVLVIVATVLWYIYTGSQANFKDNYAEFETTTKAYTDAAFLVGSSKNPLRIELNQVLAEMLAKKMTPTERLELVRRGHELLRQSQDQIDAIGDTGDVASTTVAELYKTSRSIAHLYSRSNTNKVIELSNERAAMIADIRGLSYKTNYYVSEIFKRIESDDGILTQNHIKDLNARLPELEAEFDKRSNLYASLENINYRIEQEIRGE